MANPILSLACLRTLLRTAAMPALAMLLGASALAATDLADAPLFSTTSVPGNLAFTPSVEFPTAVTQAHTDDYSKSNSHLGYFDPEKCYDYNYANSDPDLHYFEPAGKATGRTCSGKWSGNFLNWASMQAIDPFRSALTGGYRTPKGDTPNLTLLAKAVSPNTSPAQGGDKNFPTKGLSAADVTGATPFTWSGFNVAIRAYGVQMQFTGTGNARGTSVTEYGATTASNPTATHFVYIRVKVCDPTVGKGGLEANCVAYADGNYKPEGLIQQYANRIRYAAFGYYNDNDDNDANKKRDGGILRARMKFVGPDKPNPGSLPTSNPNLEWNAKTGVLQTNPDPNDSGASSDINTLLGFTVPNSGVINYLNKFGNTAGYYKRFDPVGELYYAAVRYFKNQGNVASYSAPGTTDVAKRKALADGFPVITTWDDPILYSCQKNFVLGIGDTNSWEDKNLPGSTLTAGEPAPKPSEIVADISVDVKKATDAVGKLHGLGNSLGTSYTTSGGSRRNSYMMAGLAYDSHTVDIRPDVAAKPNTKGMQTISTYWLDVLESNFEANNAFYLATKYGGFTVPKDYSPYTQTTDIAQSLWWSSGGLVGGAKRPDNYFTANKPDVMVASLTAAFAKIASDLKAFTTSFSTAQPQLTASGNASFSASFDAETWTGELEASELAFDPGTGAPSPTSRWKASAKLAAQLTGTGWNLNRRVVTWDGSMGKPFRSTGAASISSAQLGSLNTSYGAGDDSAEYLNYLRGDRSNEAPAGKGYRARSTLLGDISGSKSIAVGAPDFPYSNATNPGYSAFKSFYAGRSRMVYVGASDGMLHAFNGSLTGTDAGKEVFAYVPNALFAGPSSPGVDGLAALGNPAFVHHFYVDATAEVFDIDFGRTGGPTVGAQDWRSVLIGGLGKGGRGYYALDVTDPASMTSETAVASKVLWEYPNANTPLSEIPKMGFSYGQPVVTKTAKWGWVVVFASGYNNADGKGYFFFVNPSNGAWLETVATGAGSVGAQAGLAHPQSHVRNGTDNTADSIYAGDLLGNVWRLDVRQASGAYQAATGSPGAPLGNPVLLASLTAGGVAQPVTTRPLVEIHPRTKKRYVLIGTGRLLADSDIATAQSQTFYAIKDGTASTFNVSPPTGVSFPLSRDDLVDNSATLLTGFAPNAAKPMGWFVDFGTGASGIGRRMLTDPSSFFGVVAFVATLPSGDACSPSGSSQTFAADYDNGETALTATTTNPDGTITIEPIAFSTAIEGVVTDHKFVSVDGKSVLLGGGTTGAVGKIDTKTLGNLPLRRLNWRELSTAQ